MKEFPKKYRFSRTFRVKLKNRDMSFSYLNVWFYKLGIKALENGKLRICHANSIVKLLKRNFKKELNYKLNMALVTPVTKKPREARMGKGKGKRDHWEANVKKGTVILEVGGIVSEVRLLYILCLIQQKLPVKTKIVRLVY